MRNPILRLILAALFTLAWLYGLVMIGAMRRSYMICVAAVAIGVYWMWDAWRELKDPRGTRHTDGRRRGN